MSLFSTFVLYYTLYFYALSGKTALVGTTLPRSTGKVEPMVSAYSCFDDECIYSSSDSNFSDKSQDFVSRIWAKS